MAQMTLAQIRSLAQLHVQDTNSSALGLSNANYLDLINEALYAYAAMFPDDLSLSGRVLSASVLSGQTEKQVYLNGVVGNVRNITTAMLSTGTNRLLEIVTVPEILRAIDADSTTTGQPVKVAFASEEYISGANTNTELAVTMFMWPKTNNTYTIYLYGTVQPTALSADSDKPPYGDHECRVIARMAAIEAARLLGRNQAFIQGLAAPLPDRVKEHYGTVSRGTLPRTFEGKPVA